MPLCHPAVAVGEVVGESTRLAPLTDTHPHRSVPPHHGRVTLMWGGVGTRQPPLPTDRQRIYIYAWACICVEEVPKETSTHTNDVAGFLFSVVVCCIATTTGWLFPNPRA